jgi:hypothetical protein
MMSRPGPGAAVSGGWNKIPIDKEGKTSHCPAVITVGDQSVPEPGTPQPRYHRPRSEQIPTDAPNPDNRDQAATDPVGDRPAEGSGGPGRNRTEWQLRLLDEVAEMTMVLTRGTYAEALREQAQREQAVLEPAAEDPEPSVRKDPAAEPVRPKPVRTEPAEPRMPRFRGPSSTRDPRAIFTMLSAELRQIIALQVWIAGGGKPQSKAKAEAKTYAPGKSPAEIERKRLIRRLLDECLVFTMAKLYNDMDGLELDYVRSIIDERVEAKEILGDLMTKPISVMVDKLAREIDMPADWRLWEEEEWAKEEIRTRPPGSGYLDFPFSPEREHEFDMVWDCDPPFGSIGTFDPKPNPRGYFARPGPNRRPL